MKRRLFLLSGCAFVAAQELSARTSRPGSIIEANVHLQVHQSKESVVMSPAFCGLSYESPQLANPNFFSPDNADLIRTFRVLSPSGVLRIGGNLSDYTFWSETEAPPENAAELETADKIKDFYEWKLVDAVAARKRYAVITPQIIQNLAGFLSATGWRLIYGLNLGSGTPERAAMEAACVSKYVGPRLIAFQAGNEADFFAPRHRPKPYTFDEYWTEYQSYVTAVRSRAPGAPFAGPDVAVHMDWVVQFAERAKREAVLLSGHYYAMGPAEDPKMNADRLLQRDPKLAGQIAMAAEATAIAGVPFRMTEGNSCFHGGKPGVSDAYASALWAADYMLFLAKAGYDGVNLHGGGYGTYAPVVGDQSLGIVARPIYFGMQFAQQLAGGKFFDTELDSEGLNVAAYAVQKSKTNLLAIVNKDAVALRLKMPRSASFFKKPHTLYQLTGPGLDAKTDVFYGKIRTVGSGPHPVTVQQDSLFLSVPPYSGLIAVFG